MSYRIDHQKPAGDEVRRIALEQLDRADRELADPDLDRHEVIHQVRKRCKKLRGLLRLCRPVLGKAYRRENVRYRDAARKLSGLRDAEALIETYDRLLDRYDGSLERSMFAPIRRRLTMEKRRKTNERRDLEKEMKIFGRALADGREEVERWAGTIESFEETLQGLRKTYKRGHKAMQAALDKPSTERFHEWRKRTKYFSYHLKLVERLWKPVLSVHRKEAKRLSDLLGREHDLGVMEANLVDDFADYGNREVLVVLSGLIHEQRECLRREAAELGRRVYAEKPDGIVCRLESLART